MQNGKAREQLTATPFMTDPTIEPLPIVIKGVGVVATE
jgi:hypothetical protein